MPKKRNSKPKERVQVVVRCRPMNSKEIKSGFYDVVDILPDVNAVQIFNPKENDTEGKVFTFDAVYGCNSTQEQLYDESVKPIINSVLKGFNGTIFAYGQTGTGKTFTMEGSDFNPSQKGIIPKTFEQIFNHISQSKNTQYLVRASYIEIYQEEVKDLLNENENTYHELTGDGSSIYIKNLSSHVCRNVQEMTNVMNRGKSNRKVGATRMNEQSSRSHAIFIITIEMSKAISRTNHVKVGKLNLVDLAGSERQAKSCASGKRLKEAAKINLSLSALGNVISALSNGKNFHVPYRDSKLTRLLQDSLGGNSKTLMIANIGPANYNYDESLTTLRYANRAKNIKNKPVINEDPKDALIRQYQEEIIKLKALLQSKHLSTKPKLLIGSSTSDLENDQNVESNELNDDTDISNQFNRMSLLSDDEKVEQLKEEAEIKQNSIVKKTTQNIEILEKRIHLMESKLLRGNDIVEHTNKQQQVLQQQAEELKERTRKKKELEQRLEREEETTEELHDSSLSLQQTIEKKTAKLHTLYNKLQIIKKQTSDKIEEFNKDRNDLDLLQNDMIKNYKLNQIIIDNFISANDRKNFMAKIKFDNENQEWILNNGTSPIYQRPFATHFQEQLEKKYLTATEKANYSSIFENKNIINLNMEHHEQPANQCARDLPTVIKCAWEKALKKEDDITVVASSSKRNNSLENKRTSSSSSSSLNSEFSNTNIYPKVRGLVKKK